MIIVDTNVVSALMRRTPDAQVVAWLDTQRADDIWTTAITVFEIRYGLALLPQGRRRRDLEEAFDLVLEADLERRVLEFDAGAAIAAAALAAKRHRAGRPVDLRDTQIAGVAQHRRAAVATRNVKHFADLDVAVVDPWAGRAGASP